MSKKDSVEITMWPKSGLNQAETSTQPVRRIKTSFEARTET